LFTDPAMLPPYAVCPRFPLTKPFRPSQPYITGLTEA
jgi:hypothetical protein